MQGVQKLLIISGLVLLALGLLWPLLGRLMPGRLPGDVHITGDGWSVHLLLGTSLLLSVVLTLLLNLFFHWFGK